jgi:hypothetical protein
MTKMIVTLIASVLLTAANAGTQTEIQTRHLTEPYPTSKVIEMLGCNRGGMGMMDSQNKPKKVDQSTFLKENRYIAVFRARLTGMPPEWNFGLFDKFHSEGFENISSKVFSSAEDRCFFKDYYRNPRFEAIQVGPKVGQQEQPQPWMVSVSPAGSTQYLKFEDVPVPYWIYEFKFVAPTPDRAETLAKTFIRLYNLLVVEPQRLKEIESIKIEKQRQPQLIARVENAQKQVENLQSQLKQYPLVLPETINTLETQKWLVSVDLAGVRAKIEAIKLLKSKNSGAAGDKLADSMIVAQIELSDFLARQDKIESILTFSEKRNRVLIELEHAGHELNEAAPIQKAGEQKIKDRTHNLDTWYFQPLKPIDNTITVQPIRPPASITQPAK